MKNPRERIPPTLFDDLPLHFRNGPAIQNVRVEKLKMRITDPTHVVS